MSSALQLESAQLLPIKAASELVPYSRDYVARLAREGKIIAVYIDRQWFVDTTSLKNFYTNALLEESVRKRYLSVVRKHDLEVKEVYRTRLEKVAQKHKACDVVVAVHSGLVVVCGLVTGLFLMTANSYLTNERLQFLAQLPAVGFLSTGFVANVTGLPDTQETVFSDFIVIESDTALSLENGILLLPKVTASTTAAVNEFFSDPVTVVMVSTTTGIIRSQNVASSITEMSFVRVPGGVVAAAATTTTAGNVENP